MQVPFQKCADPDTVAHPERVKYPNGLICAGDTGTKYWLVFPDAKCINYHSFMDLYYLNLFYSYISGKDSCQGDSGGPLMKLVIEPGKEPYYEWIGKFRHEAYGRILIHLI